MELNFRLKESASGVLTTALKKTRNGIDRCLTWSTGFDYPHRRVISQADDLFERQWGLKTGERPTWEQARTQIETLAELVGGDREFVLDAYNFARVAKLCFSGPGDYYGRYFSDLDCHGRPWGERTIYSFPPEFSDFRNFREFIKTRRGHREYETLPEKTYQIGLPEQSNLIA